jgi:hypothetical protein
MADRFGIPREILQTLRSRDGRCVYCGKKYSQRLRGDRPTIEHLNERPPFHWEDGVVGLTEDGLVICCGSCNSSRGKKTHREWFTTRYCVDRSTPINERTVAKPVRDYLKGIRGRR